MSIIRVVKTANYSIISNVCFRDPKLSARAKGIYGFVMTLPDDWIVHFNNIQNNFREGRDALLKAWRELLKAGYIVKSNEGFRTKDGKFKNSCWIFYEMPQKTPSTENPCTEKPHTENPTLLRTNRQKTNTPYKSPEAGDTRGGFFSPTKKKEMPEKKKGFTDAYVLEQLERLAYKWNKRADKYGTYYRRVRVVNTSYNMAAVKKLLQECKKLGFDWDEYMNTAMGNIAKTMEKYYKKSTQASEYFNFLFAIRATQFNILYEGVKNFVVDREPSYRKQMEEEGVSIALGEDDPRNPYGRKAK